VAAFSHGKRGSLRMLDEGDRDCPRVHPFILNRAAAGRRGARAVYSK
jgi:hypothetical protein